MSKQLTRFDILRPHEPVGLPETPLSTPNATSERPPASPAAADESPEDIAKRWSIRFKSVGGSKSSGALGVSRSASVCDLNLNPMPSQVMKVSLHLSVSVPATNFGDSVILSGNNEALGMWKAERSPPLFTSAEQFPVWSVDICMVLKMPLMPLEFKFAIIREGTGFVVSIRYMILLCYMKHDISTGLGNRHSQPCALAILRIHFYHVCSFQHAATDVNHPLPPLAPAADALCRWVKQTKPVFPDARTVRCKRPSDCQKLDWICSCPCCNQTSVFAAVFLSLPLSLTPPSFCYSLAFLDAEFGCNFASILIVSSTALLAARRDSLLETEFDEDSFGAAPEPAPTASKNSLILAAYA
jgi:hypothetical protein